MDRVNARVSLQVGAAANERRDQSQRADDGKRG
jgi:hypothetical protein